MFSNIQLVGGGQDARSLCIRCWPMAWNAERFLILQEFGAGFGSG